MMVSYRYRDAALESLSIVLENAIQVLDDNFFHAMYVKPMLYNEKHVQRW